jgi:hypothetical protein
MVEAKPNPPNLKGIEWVGCWLQRVTGWSDGHVFYLDSGDGMWLFVCQSAQDYTTKKGDFSHV